METCAQASNWSKGLEGNCAAILYFGSRVPSQGLVARYRRQDGVESHDMFVVLSPYEVVPSIHLSMHLPAAPNSNGVGIRRNRGEDQFVVGNLCPWEFGYTLAIDQMTWDEVRSLHSTVRDTQDSFEALYRGR